MASSPASSQMNRVQRELMELRATGKVTSGADKFKDSSTPLTTPEEAEAFLLAMRKKEISNWQKPPPNLSAAAVNSWHLQQRQREQELRERRREAEDLLRGYRMTMSHNKLPEAEKRKYKDFSSRKKLFHSGMPMVGEAMGDPDSDEHENLSESKTNRSASESQAPTEREGGQDISDCASKSEVTGEQSDALLVKSPGTPSETQTDKDTTFSVKGGESKTSAAQNGSSDGKKLPPTKARGKDDKTEWREFVEPEPEARFPAEEGRYHLFASYACPGSHRALIVRALKGLKGVVNVTIVHPIWRLTKEGSDNEQRGWVFSVPNGEPFKNTAGRGGPFPQDFSGCGPDPLFNSYSIRDIYEKAGDRAGKFTIPLMWDTVEGTIVNNESSDIAYMLNSSFNEFAENPCLDLYKEDKSDELNDVIDWLSPLMIHGVYRCGFAKKQEAYEKAITELTAAFDHASTILEKQRYLTGNTLTDADIRLFVTLFRFDEIYSVYFRANTRLVLLTPSLLNYCRDIYHLEGVSETCSMEHCKAHFFCSHAEWNKFSIIPKGIGFMDHLEKPHNREEVTNDNVDKEPISENDGDGKGEF
mmetsp:Transcript_11320/g.16628  ORF Transcript_11320/g.16628 Transcript_11320/m.16628 type:complete len:587 (-) Transcript_11320:9-1769(-)